MSDQSCLSYMLIFWDSCSQQTGSAKPLASKAENLFTPDLYLNRTMTLSDLESEVMMKFDARYCKD